MISPRVLVVMRDQWRRAVLRAALREVGYDAVGTRDGVEALHVIPELPDRGPIGLIIADQDSVTEKVMAALHERYPAAPTVLLARATLEPLPGDFSRLLRRPFSVADVVSAAEAVLPLAESLRHPLDLAGGPPEAPAPGRSRRNDRHA